MALFPMEQFVSSGGSTSLTLLDTQSDNKTGAITSIPLSFSNVTSGRTYELILFAQSYAPAANVELANFSVSGATATSLFNEKIQAFTNTANYIGLLTYKVQATATAINVAWNITTSNSGSKFMIYGYLLG